MKKRIILSVGMIVFVAAIAIGATGAFFSDTETSTGNTFTAGALDLRVDSESHYNGNVCTEVTAGIFQWVGQAGWPVPGTPCDGTWAETDLGATHKFFNLTDVKPGDIGEDTISLHVYDNDAWGRFVISNVSDLDVTCTEPENEATLPGPVDADLECNNATSTPAAGELAENISFWAWIDDGSIPGFQGLDDEGEGDNVQQEREVTVITEGTVDEAGETHNIWEALAAYRASLGATCAEEDADGNGQTGTSGDEETYVECQGIAVDGRMVGSTTYYFGLGWDIPETVGNEIQTDSLVADLSFEVEQHRNNPSPFTP